MSDFTRRQFLRSAAYLSGAATAAAFPPVIQRALALPPKSGTGSMADVQHIVILMQENRSFDHYFGTLRGVRGFRDRHPVPLMSGKPVWFQSDGEREISPFRLDTRTTSAARVPSTPHTFNNAQAAWNQGKFGYWPKFKTPMSMAYYIREGIPFQFALADAFTLCDAHHCSVTTGTDPNRVVFWSGSNFDPALRARGENCTAARAEVNNLRCQVSGTWPSPGYQYQGSALTWQTVPDVLEAASISWRIYQDPNDNWDGLMHGGLAFASFRNAQPGEANYQKGLSHASLEDFVRAAKSGTLPQVCWILPPRSWSEHPAGSSSIQGAEYTSGIIDALIANPDTWGQSVLFLSFDENDGLFDHVPPPAPPSFNSDGTLAGQSTVDLGGMYLNDAERQFLHPEDTVSGTVRPWGLGPRVPLYVISPWSRGGWVNSQVFDHTSVSQFLEKRFGITVPAISPWHRAVCGDLTSCFDFVSPAEKGFIDLPAVRNASEILAAAAQRPAPVPPPEVQPLLQEPGLRRSRALPYELQVHQRAAIDPSTLELEFRNTGRMGAVFHVYDRLHLERIPRRYTVEGGKRLHDHWSLRSDCGSYDLWVYGPNGFVREFRGRLVPDAPERIHAEFGYNRIAQAVRIDIHHSGVTEACLTLRANAYRSDGPWTLRLHPHQRLVVHRSVAGDHNWYDYTLVGQAFEQRFAGRMETGSSSFSDPAV